MSRSEIMTGNATAQFGHRAAVVIPPQPKIWSVAVGFIVTLPLWWLLFNTFLAVSGGLWWWAIITTAAIALVLAVVLAREDERTLRASGFTVTASPWLAMLPIAYLAHRSGLMWASRFESYRPLWAHIICISFVIFAIVIAPGLLELAARLITAR